MGLFHWISNLFSHMFDIKIILISLMISIISIISNSIDIGYIKGKFILILLIYIFSTIGAFILQVWRCEEKEKKDNIYSNIEEAIKQSPKSDE